MLHQHGVQWRVRNQSSLIIFIGFCEDCRLKMTLSTIVELVVARGVYERLSTQYQKIKVRTDVKEARLLREIGRNPTLVHIRDGVGQAKAGIPLLIEMSLALIKTTEHLSAWVKYAQKLDFSEALAKFMVCPRKFRNYATTSSF